MLMPDKPEETVIDNIATEEPGDGIIYDLAGRRIESITRPGTYIVNGRAVIIR